jgi:hypothetical protein
MSSYKTGTTAPNVILNVDVNTIGVAATRANKRPTGAAGGGISVAHSVDATGDVKNAPLGGAASLNGNTLVIATLVNLFGTVEERMNEFQTLSATYTLAGGDEGSVTFDGPDLKLNDGDFVRITLVKSIDLNP